MAPKLLQLYCLLLISLSTNNRTLAIVESYSPSLTGISFVPQNGYNDPYSDRYGSVSYSHGGRNNEAVIERIGYRQINDEHNTLDDDWRYETIEKPLDGVHHHGPDCPKHGMHHQTLSQYKHKEWPELKQYEKSLPEPLHEISTYGSIYYGDVPLEYELLNNYNDGRYGKDASKKIYEFPRTAESRHGNDKWPRVYSNSFHKQGIMDDGDYVKGGIYETYPHDDLHDHHYLQEKEHALSYQTRTTYEPWLHHGISKKAGVKKDIDTNTNEPLQQWKYFQDENRKKYKYDNIIFKSREKPLKTLQTYDLRAIKSDPEKQAYRIRSPYKELTDKYTVQYQTDVVLPYEIFPSKFMPLGKYNNDRDSTSSLAYRNKEVKLNDNFKGRESSKYYPRVKFPYKLPRSKDYKEGPVEDANLGERTVNEHWKKEPNPTKAKDTERPVGPQTRNPFAFGELKTEL